MLPAQFKQFGERQQSDWWKSTIKQTHVASSLLGEGVHTQIMLIATYYRAHYLSYLQIKSTLIPQIYCFLKLLDYIASNNVFLQTFQGQMHHIKYFSL